MWPGASPSSVVEAAARLTIVALIIVAVYTGRDLLIPLSLAAILSFILFPLVRRLNHLRIPQALSVAIVTTLFVGALLGGMTIVGKEISQLVEDVPRYEMNLRG